MPTIDDAANVRPSFTATPFPQFGFGSAGTAAQPALAAGTYMVGIRGQVVTPHQRAVSEFLTHVTRIVGVVEVEAVPGENANHVDITVMVPDLRGDTARRVFDLEAVLRRKYQGSRLLVRVIEERARLAMLDSGAA